MLPLLNRPRLGEMLVRQGVIADGQLQSALARHQQEGQRLGAVLKAMGLVSDEEILETVSAQVGVPYLSLSDPAVALTRVTDALPVKFLQAHKIFPWKYDGRTGSCRAKCAVCTRRPAVLWRRPVSRQ